jgi:hypothetical protein
MDVTTALARLEAAGREQHRNVRVDHGRTGCVTPPAIPCIARTWERTAARAAAKGGAHAAG